ncbi:MAG: SDR family NAD(P)-dependent oxidoreductase [Ktedonobacteraceae bacterium]|nr:SDR family NAD(P)-dependent oxidoreductase [Ktedonobacteraceae bacterium]
MKVALVTGASSGIGKATATALVSAGYITYATARRLEALISLKDLGCRVLQLDVTDDASMIAAVRVVEAEHGAIDVLVNNAGYGEMGPLEELDMVAVRREFETNVFGLLRMCQLVLPGMRAQGYGRIVNIGSVGGLFTAPGAGAYHASKYAVESFSDALRYEVQPFGVDVVLIEPTGVRTPYVEKSIATIPQARSDSPYAVFNKNLDTVIQQMFGRNARGILAPEDVANVVVKAVQARRPQTRYKVGVVAHLLPLVRRALPDRRWDALMRLQFPMS